MRQGTFPVYDPALKIDGFNTIASTTGEGKRCIIVVHGIMGSELFLERQPDKCSKVWPPTDFFAYPSNPQDKLAMMMLDEQGRPMNHVHPLGIDEPTACKAKKKNYFGANDSYGDLVRYLQRYFGEEDVLFYNYDWRKSVPDVGGAFAAHLENVAQKYERIYIVAHSMGGLVSMAAMQRFQEGSIRLITLGTPFWGAPYMMAYMVSNNWLGPSTDYNLLDMNVSVFKNIVRNMPSSYDLLPSSAYLAQTPYFTMVYNQNKQTIIDKMLDKEETEAFIYQNLNSVLYEKKQAYERSIDMVDFLREREVATIVGYDFATPDRVVLRKNVRTTEVKASSKVIQEEDCVVEKRDFGDGTVPLVSATLNYQIPEGKSLYVKERHGGLVHNKDVLTYVVHKIQDWDMSTKSFVGYNKSVLTETMQTVLRKEMFRMMIEMKMTNEEVGLYDKDGQLITSIQPFSNYYISNDGYREDETLSRWTRLFFGLEKEDGTEKYFIVIYSDKAVEMIIDEEPETIGVGETKIYHRICVIHRSTNNNQSTEEMVDK